MDAPQEEQLMPATAALPRRKPTARKSPPARPVSELLLELAYRLHTTRVVGSRSPR